MRSQFQKYFRVPQTIIRQFGKHKTPDDPPTMDEIESSDILAPEAIEDPKTFNAKVKADRNSYSYQTEKPFNAHILHKNMDAYNRETKRQESDGTYRRVVATKMEDPSSEDKTLGMDYFEERGLNDDYEAEDKDLGKVKHSAADDVTAKAQAGPVIESPNVDTTKESQKYTKAPEKEGSKKSKSRVSDSIYIDDDMYERNIKCPEEPIPMIRNDAPKGSLPRDV